MPNFCVKSTLILGVMLKKTRELIRIGTLKKPDPQYCLSASFSLTCVEPLGLAVVGVPDQKVGGLMQCCGFGSQPHLFDSLIFG
jgi:hypothetical protein